MWRSAIPWAFQDFMELLFDDLAVLIDWSHPPRVLNTELESISRRGLGGRRRVDCLIQVRILGDDAPVSFHIEVQGRRQDEFSERLLVYGHRLYEACKGATVVTLAVLHL